LKANDPNTKMAPAGQTQASSIPEQTPLPYQVSFENQPAATAPAQEVVVSDRLDAALDLDTFQLTNIAFANRSIDIPPGFDHYEPGVPVRARGVDLLGDARAALARATRTFPLTLQAIAPATGWAPENPLLGLLYPNDETHRGEGSVSYRVAPKAGLPSG